MAYVPPRWLERLGTLLVPPAGVEHTLGDLAESSHADGHYLRQLVSVVPRVVWSQVRRRVTVVGIAFHAGSSGIALLVAHGFPKAPLFADPWAALRIAAPWVVWTAGCVLAAAYGPADKPTQSNRRLFGATAVAALAVSALLDVPVGRTAVALAATFGIVLLLSLPWLTQTPPPALSRETLVVHARLFQRGIRWRNARESLACVAVFGFSIRGAWTAGTTRAVTAHLLVAGGVAFVMAYLHLRAGARAVPDGADARTIWQFHRSEIARQRDILRAIVWWYLLPFVPGMVMTFVSRPGAPLNAAVGLIIVCGLFAFVRQLNLWGARWLDGELRKVDALEGQL